MTFDARATSLPSAHARTEFGVPSVVGFLGAHLLLAPAFQVAPELATAHALLVCAVALWAVLRWSLLSIACLAAYAVGADVLWRMMGAHVPWELAKYLAAFLCIGGVLRLGHRARWNVLASVYFLALLPSIAVLLKNYQGAFQTVVQSVSFNLSGPLSLFSSVWFMSQLRLDASGVRRLLICFIAPALTIAGYTLLATHAAAQLNFTDESSFATSGGFGPNQVLLALSLGALASLLLTLDAEVRGWSRGGALALVVFFGIQSAMTFSRGGLYSLAIAFIPAALVLLADGGYRRRLAATGVVLAVVTIFVVIPRLDAFTSGAITTRFADTNPTNRDQIVREDFRIWEEHPVLGLGPGGARFERRGESKLAHTEYTRLLSEHGLLGVVALIALASIFLTQLARPQPAAERALRLAFMLWSLASMVHVAMRIAAVGVVFGWGCAGSLMRPEERLASASPPRTR